MRLGTQPALYRRGTAGVPFFLSVVVLNAVRTFWSGGLRRRIERFALSVVAVAKRRFFGRWFSVAVLIYFEVRTPLKNCTTLPEPTFRGDRWLPRGAAATLQRIVKA